MPKEEICHFCKWLECNFVIFGPHSESAERLRPLFPRRLREELFEFTLANDVVKINGNMAVCWSRMWFEAVNFLSKLWLDSIDSLSKCL